MIETDQNRIGCRIVIGLKATSDLDVPLEAATVLAEAMKAEVMGLFVEEEEMFNLAGLPFAKAFEVGSGRSVQLTPEAMQKAMSRGAQMCRRALSMRAEKARIKWSFSAERGELLERVAATLSTGDFAVLPGENRGFGMRRLLGQLRASPRDRSGVMIAASAVRKRRRGPVVAIDDGDAAGERTVRLAASIAAVTGAQLTLFAIGATDDAIDRIVERAREVAGTGTSLDVHRLIPGEPRAVSATLMHVAPSFVVGDLEGEPFRDDETALQLFRAAKAPVVLVSD